jgi:hypothetical protein
MRISGREKIFLWIGAVCAGAIVLFLLVVDPALKRSRELDRLIPQKERELQEIRLLRQGLEALNETKAALAQRMPAGARALPPLSRLDGWIETAGLRSNVRSIKPSPSSGAGGEGMIVEMGMEKTDLPRLTHFLYEIQSGGGGVRIARIAIKPRYTTPRILDISMQMVFYQG